MAKPNRTSRAKQKANADAAMRKRISDRISEEAAAKKSQHRIEMMAADALRKKLEADERKEAERLAEQRYRAVAKKRKNGKK